METEKNSLGWKGTDLVDFARGILQAHLTALENLSGTFCFITETEREYYEGSEIKEAEDPLFGLELEQVGQEWVWDIAPPPELSPCLGLRNKMIGKVS